MPGGFASAGMLCNATTIAVDTTTSKGVSVSYSAANTKGSYVQLIASTAADTCAILINILITGANSWAAVVDIAVGAAGSEVVIASNLLCTAVGNSRSNYVYFLPLFIPAGTRVAARAQGDTGADNVWLTAQIFDGDYVWPSFAGVDSIGFNAATTIGTLMPVGTANTVGSYSQLTASTSRDYAGLMYVIDPAATSSGTISQLNGYLIDIAVGAAGSEIVILPQQFVLKDGGASWQMIAPAVGFPIMLPIPSGTRIAARMQSNAVAGNDKFNLTMYGLYQ